METRKCPHFIEGLDSLLFTLNDGIKWWKKYMNLDTSKWKNYGYSHEHTEKFLKRIGEYHILAHIYEPFGYSIFQVDFGKIPIFHDWIPKYDYPLRGKFSKRISSNI